MKKGGIVGPSKRLFINFELVYFSATLFRAWAARWEAVTDGYNLSTLTKVGVKPTGIDLTAKIILMCKFFSPSEPLSTWLALIPAYFLSFFWVYRTGRDFFVCLQIFTSAMCVSSLIYLD